MKKLALAIVASALSLSMLTSCSEKAPKILVLYYSQTGVTETVANEISGQLGADIERFDVTEPYDGAYQQTIRRAGGENSNGTVPELVPLTSDLKKYDVIFLGYPIWFGTAANPVRSLLNAVDFKGKKIVPFCTFGSGGLVQSVSDLRHALKDSEVLDGYGVRASRIEAAPEEISTFLINNGFKEGEPIVLPEYSEQKVVGEDEKQIFSEACSDYAMPLGMPLTCGSRTVEGGTDYKFRTNSNTTIYIIVRDGKKPEFTRVDR